MLCQSQSYRCPTAQPPNRPPAKQASSKASHGSCLARCQAKVSAIKALNQVPISLKLPLSQPADAADDAGTTFMVALAGSYWNAAVNHEAWLMVMVE